MHATLEKFGYPASALAETENWIVLLHPAQVTPGALVLVHKFADVTSLGDLSAAAGREFPLICAQIEQVLRDRLGAEKFNYLCLMMVDPHVHFHVLPRYGGPVEIAGRRFDDSFWPGPPDIRVRLEFEPEEREMLHAILRQAFRDRGYAIGG